MTAGRQHLAARQDPAAVTGELAELSAEVIASAAPQAPVEAPWGGAAAPTDRRCGQRRGAGRLLVADQDVVRLAGGLNVLGGPLIDPAFR